MVGFCILFAENNQTLPISTMQGRILVILLTHGKRVLAEKKRKRQMNAIQTLSMINAEVKAQLHSINQMNLTAWVALANQLGVELNNREHAAKKLALRKLQLEGKLA
jgi:hypothetical protein